MLDIPFFDELFKGEDVYTIFDCLKYNKNYCIQIGIANGRETNYILPENKHTILVSVDRMMCVIAVTGIAY